MKKRRVEFNPDDVLVLPMTVLDGERWLTISWRLFRADNSVGTVWYDGSVTNFNDYKHEMLAADVVLFIFYQAELAAMVWITHATPRSGRIHFATFGKHGRIARYLGQAAREYLLGMKFDDHSYCFDVIVGFTPKKYGRAVNTVLKSGWVKVGEIPNYAWIAKDGKSTDVVVTAATRGSL